MWERPLYWVNRFVISFPKDIHNFKIQKVGFIENGDASIFIFGEEVEVSGLCNCIDLIGIPYSIFEFDDTVFNQEGNCKVNLHIHFVLEPEEQLAILACLFFA